MPLAKRTFVTQEFTVAAPGSVPRVLPGADRIPKGRIDADVLARLDGVATVADVARLVELSDVECASVIARLVEIGCATLASDDAPNENGARATVPSE